MKQKTFPLLALAFILAALGGCNRPLQITEDHYVLAEQFLQPNIEKMVYHLEVRPHWLEDSTGFWHMTWTEDGKRFFLTRLADGTVAPAFDHDMLAKALAGAAGEEVDAAELPFNRIRPDREGRIGFRYAEADWLYDPAADSLVQTEQEDGSANRRGISPDGRLQAFTRDYNLFVRNLETGGVTRLSRRGTYGLEYANPYGWYDIMEGEGGARPENLFVSWSPDSRKLLTYLVDLRKAEKMYLLDFSADSLFRPRLLSYYRGSPGDTTVVYNIPVLFDLDAGTEVVVDLPPFPHFLGVDFRWAGDSESLHAIYAHRGFKQADLVEVDAPGGGSRVVWSETSDTSVEYNNIMLQRLGTDRVLLSSQRSGWNHLYLHDWQSGSLIRPLTQGDYVVRSLLHVDESDGWVYFLAGGREPDRNPYYTHLYRVSLDGGEPLLLTPEDAHHQISLSPCGQYVVDNFSTVEQPTISVVRDLFSGKEILRISEADPAPLLATGWTPPMRFSALGRDGRTEIHGIVYRPVGFRPGNKYPVIDYTYTGPHTAITPKSFADAVINIQNPLRAFGFSVIVVDGMGTAHRSKAFRDVSYRNMGQGLACHVAAIRQLAGRHAWLDTTRVGIYGHSAGGYDAGRGLLAFPGFYKVGVASAADHDHRMEKAWWPEMYMGYPVGDFYHEQSNVTNAHALEGRLLIAHGGIDENVNPSATYKLAEYLIRAGKDFDMLILPSRSHSFGRSDGDYFTKVRWNYFIQHLLPAEPVLHYQFRTIP
jgi:dipeptidyl aminopeptidase/acylaminoacyl peptidase